MKKQFYKKSINGYIEGYYGKLLTWKSRNLIISSLNRSKINSLKSSFKIIFKITFFEPMN